MIRYNIYIISKIIITWVINIVNSPLKSGARKLFWGCFYPKSGAWVGDGDLLCRSSNDVGIRAVLFLQKYFCKKIAKELTRLHKNDIIKYSEKQ